MSPTPEPPPEHVCSAFGIKKAEPELVEGGPVWRCGDVVLRPAADSAQAAWVAQTLDGLVVPGVRIAQPLRSTDGRWVVGHWTAIRHVEGRVEPQHDEVVAVGVRLHQATAHFGKPKFLGGGDDLLAVADRAAWGEQEAPMDADLGGRLFAVLAGSLHESELPAQLVHGELFGNVYFCPSEAPAVTDFIPYWRPAEWAAAVVVVDSLAWGGADEGIIQRWAHLPEWPQMLLRALLFRLAVHAMHPHSTRESMRGLERVAQQFTGVV